MIKEWNGIKVLDEGSKDAFAVKYPDKYMVLARNLKRPLNQVLLLGVYEDKSVASSFYDSTLNLVHNIGDLHGIVFLMPGNQIISNRFRVCKGFKNKE